MNKDKDSPEWIFPLPIRTPLQEAASCGDGETTRSLLVTGAIDADARDMSSGPTNESGALYLAAQGGHLEVLNALLGAGADVNGRADVHDRVSDETTEDSFAPDVRCRQMMTPLHYAALHGHVAVAQALLDAGAFRNPLSMVETRYLGGICSPLHLAVGEGNLDMVRVLVTAGVKMNLEAIGLGSGDCTPLFLAARDGHAAIITVLAEAGADVNHQNFKGKAAIHEAKSSATVEALLRAGANPNVVGGRKFDIGHTPLGLQISARGHSEISVRTAAIANVQLLLSYDADVDQRTRDKVGGLSPPVEIASEIVNDEHCLAVLSILLDAGADPNLPVPHAINEGRVEVLRLLLRVGANKNARFYCTERSTLLHIACRATQVPCVLELLEWGANPDLREWSCQRRLKNDRILDGDSDNVASLSELEATCAVCNGLGASPAHVVGVGNSSLECISRGHIDPEDIVDRSKDEDEDDVIDGELDCLVEDLKDLTYVPRLSVTTGLLQGYVADLRDRNAIRRALRRACTWWRRKGVLLLKARLAHETATSLATAGASSADCDNSGTDGDKASVLDFWVRYREQVCVRNALGPRTSATEVKETEWPSVLAGFLLALDGEEGVFRNVVMFL